MKTVLTTVAVLLFTTTFSQNIGIGASKEYVKSSAAAVAYSRPNVERKLVYQNGKVSEVVLEVTEMYSMNYKKYITYDKHYVISDDTLSAIMENYYNISYDELKASCISNSLPCTIKSENGFFWFLGTDLETVNAIYLDPISKLASNMLQNINSTFIPVEVKKQIDRCVLENKQP